MKTESIAPEQLRDALANAERSAGWNFRDVPIRNVMVAGCTIYVVPAKLWAYRRKERMTANDWRAQSRAPEGTAA